MKPQIRFRAIAFGLFVASSAQAIGLTPEQQGQVRTIVKQEMDEPKGQFQTLKTSVRDDSAKQNKEIEELQKSVNQLTTQLDEECLPTITKRLDALEEKLAAFETNTATRVGPTPVQHGTHSYLWGAILFSLLLGVVGCLRHPVSAGKTGSTEPLVCDKPKCPRCGQEHDPGATICTNCRTQF